jgi:hypothetical protein
MFSFEQPTEYGDKNPLLLYGVMTLLPKESAPRWIYASFVCRDAPFYSHL